MEHGTMQRCRTSYQIAQVQHIKTVGIGKHDTQDKVFWDLKQNGKYSYKSTWNLIRQRKTTDNIIAQGKLPLDEVISRFHILKILYATAALFLKENQCDTFFFMERQRTMCGITLDGHWESEFRHTIRHIISSIPIVEDLLNELGGSKIFSKIDLRLGYHQLRIAKDDVPKTAFRTHSGHFDYLDWLVPLYGEYSTSEQFRICLEKPEYMNHRQEVDYSRALSIRQELTLLKAVEAAHDAQMKCVAVACKHPLYELGAADLVVRHLDELSIVDLKNLAAVELTEFGSPEPELEEEDDPYPPICGIMFSTALNSVEVIESSDEDNLAAVQDLLQLSMEQNPHAVVSVL
ncbi:hypothetical protein FXO37_25106 [Capsicum annuum]|nr:hypothetical protein FXO37_25106 [Capsicum annuum]